MKIIWWYKICINHNFYCVKWLAVHSCVIIGLLYPLNLVIWKDITDDDRIKCNISLRKDKKGLTVPCRKCDRSWHLNIYSIFSSTHTVLLMTLISCPHWRFATLESWLHLLMQWSIYSCEHTDSACNFSHCASNFSVYCGMYYVKNSELYFCLTVIFSKRY